MSWKNWSYWFRGGVILGVLSVIIGIILTLFLGFFLEGHPPIMTPSLLLIFLAENQTPLAILVLLPFIFSFIKDESVVIFFAYLTSFNYSF